MKNLTFKAAMLKGSQPTVNRQSTDGQSQRHCKQTPLSKRWKVLMTLVFLFTFAIGNVWGADPTHASPAIVKVANRNFLDLSNTPSNVTVSTDLYSNYGPGYFISNKSADLSKSWWNFTGTFKSASNSITIPSGAVGFHEKGSSSSSEFYQNLQLRTGDNRMTQMDFYVTGTTKMGFIWKNGGTSNKYLTFTIYEMDVTGATAVDGSIPVETIYGSKTSNSDQYDATGNLNASKYYHIVVTPVGESNINFNGLTFKHAPSCSTEITTQPSDASLAIEAANPELTIVATNVASYAWKESSDGESYDGSSTLSTSASYTPEVNDAVQTKYYYCEVTSDCDGTTVVKSDIVTVEVVASIVNVTGVSLDKTSQEFTLGATTTTTLTATVAPNDATNKAISWESSAPTKVSVTDNGDGTADIEGLAEGTATITVTTDDGSYTATCNVTVHPDPCSAWGLGTSYNTTPGSGSSTTAGDLTITNIGGVSNSSTTVYSGSGSVKTFTPNSGSKYLTGSLGGSVIESVTVCISTANTGEGQNTADIVFSSAATFDAEKLLNYTGQTYKVHSFVVGTTSDDKGTYTFTAPAGAKSFAVGRNFGFTSDRGGASRASSLSGNRNVYYIQACPHVCDGSAATKFAVTGTTTICDGNNTDITLANSQSGAKYVLLKNDVEVASSEKTGTGSALVWSVNKAGTYTVKAIEYGDFCETEMTGSAVITAAESPVITTQPTASQKVAVNSAVELSVATSTEDVSYQWYSTTDPTNPATEMAGKNAATLNITSAATATTMYYYCVISKSGMCSVESDLAEVITKTGCETEELATSTITGANTDNHSGCSTTIKLQDANGKLNGGAYFEMSLNGGFKAGDIVTVNVKANDYESGKLYMVYGTHSSYSGYQVQNGPTEGNTADVEFIIPSDMATIGFLRITNTGDEEKEQNHEIKSVTVERETCYCAKPTIGTQPASSAICSGLTVTLTVGNITGGVAPYTYAWYNGDGTAVSGGSGATTASYTTAALAANASYYCVVSTADGCSAQSSTAAITIKPATTITTQPVDAGASVGIAQTFSVEATGAGTLEYKWQIKNGENWDNIANADEATYSVSKDAAGAYQFRCIVSGDCGDDVISNVVTLTVSADIYTVTYNANGGTCATPSATWSDGDEALVLPTATKENYDFIGWYDAATGGNKIASPYTPSASIELFAHYMPKLVQAIYSNSFDAFIKNQAVTVYYMEGESAPTLTSIKVLGVENPTYVDNGSNIVLTVDEVAYTFPVTKTAVAPHTGTGEKETFDGTETYVKSGYSFSTENNKYGWRFSKTDDNWSRETPGNTRIYFFLGAAEQIVLENGGTARAMKVYRNGVELATPTSSGSATIAGTNAPAMYAIVSNQDGGDGAFKSITITPWVPVTGITLKEGTTAISSKEIAQGAQFTLTAEVTPANASNPAIVWESENASIASVDGGVVTGEATGGPVNIIARSQDDNTIYAACAVTVAAPCTPATVAWDVEPVDGIKGHNGSASVTTNYAAGLEVVSSDPTVASVSNDGVNITINYLKKGTTKITATVIGDGSTYCNTPVFVEKTITVEPDCPVSGNLFTWAIDPEADEIVYNVVKNDDEEMATAADVMTIAGGTVAIGTTSSSAPFTIDDGSFKFRQNGNNYMRIELECPLQVGDVISYTSDNSANRYMSIYKDDMSGTAVTTATDGTRKYFVANTESPIYGAEVLYIKGSNSDCSFKTFSIDRLAPVTGVSLANATIAIGNTVTPTMTLLPSNEAYYESIAWSIVGEGEGTVANINATTGAVTALAAGSVTVQVKLNNDESLKATCTVEVISSFEQVDVTESTVWDMNNVSTSAIELPDNKRNGLLLANVNGVNNNASFNSQALYFEGQHIGRTSNNVKHLAGRKLQFNVTIPGAVFVTFASNGSNQRTVAINGTKCARTTNDGTYITYALAVEPGSVEIVGYQGTSANQYVRISKIEFKAEDNYHRTVNPAYLGTLCWTNNAILGGATLYEFAGKNEYNYLVFDEVEENRLEAGKPYIFMPENGITEIKVYNTDDEPALTEADLEPVNNMYGTVEGKTLVPGQDDNMYYFSSNHIWAVKDFSVSITVPAYFCYVDYEAVLNAPVAPAAAPGRRRVTMGVQGEQVVTGVENLNASEQPVKLLINGQIFIIRGEKMFDVTGKLVK